MSAMSDYLENQIVDHLFRAATFAKPAAIYIAMFTVAPSDSGGGTEVAGGAYARTQITQADANFDATQGGNSGNSSGTSGATQNSADIIFPAPIANWGTIVAFGIFDAVTGGNLLIHGSLSTNKTVNNGDPAPKFSTGDLDITFA